MLITNNPECLFEKNHAQSPPPQELEILEGGVNNYLNNKLQMKAF